MKTAKRKGVDHVLVLNVLRHESGGNRKAVSSVGARGLMQVMPEHYPRCGVSDPFNKKQNLTCGIGILASALKEAKGNVKLALAMYNGNPVWARKMYNTNWPCKRYPSDCGQNKYYVKNIYSAYVGDLKAMGRDA